MQIAKEEWEATLRPMKDREEELRTKSKAIWDETVEWVGKVAVAALDCVEADEYERYKLILVACVPDDIKTYINEHTPTKDQ